MHHGAVTVKSSPRSGRRWGPNWPKATPIYEWVSWTAPDSQVSQKVFFQQEGIINKMSRAQFNNNNNKYLTKSAIHQGRRFAKSKVKKSREVSSAGILL